MIDLILPLGIRNAERHYNHNQSLDHEIRTCFKIQPKRNAASINWMGSRNASIGGEARLLFDVEFWRCICGK